MMPLTSRRPAPPAAALAGGARSTRLAAPPTVPARQLTSECAAPRPRSRCPAAAARAAAPAAAAAAAAAAAPAPAPPALAPPGAAAAGVNMVFKFGGSSVADAARMREVADIVCSFPEYLPVVVLSAMGKTTNLLLDAGAAALGCRPAAVASLPPLRAVKELHRTAADELGVDAGARDEVEALLLQLQQLLVGVSILQEFTPRARDSLVSFGERLSTRLFAAYLNAQGVPARQLDAPEVGLITNDAFQNAEVNYAQSLPNLRAALALAPGAPRVVQVLTGFLGRGAVTGAVTTLGRGGSDLTATLVGAALGLDEVTVWKDVDGVLTSDPRVVDDTRPVARLTYEEATELAFFGATVLHPLAMQPAAEAARPMGVRVRNSYNRRAPGTLITRARDMEGSLVTSLVLKQSVTLVDVVSTRMLGQFGFLARVFGVFEAQGISVDVVATSEVSVSATLDPARAWGRDLVDQELEALVAAFAGVARASVRRGVAIVSIICNVERTSEILERAFRVLGREGAPVRMMSQGASKSNISLVLDDADAPRALRALHAEFFGPSAGE